MRTILRSLVLLWGLALLPAAAFAQAAPEAGVLDVRGVALSEALVRLAQARSLKLAYAPEMVAGKTSGCVTRALVVDAALRCVLDGSGLYAERLPNGVYVIREGVAPRPAEPTADSGAAAETGTISGVVRGRGDGVILVGAHVRVVGTPLGAASGRDGTFSINRVPAGSYDLEVSMLGFAATRYPRVRVGARQEVAVELELAEAALALDEVVVSAPAEKPDGGPSTVIGIDYDGLRVGPVAMGILIGVGSRTPIQVNGLGGVAGDSLAGVQFAGLFNAATGAVRGAQFSGLVNTVGGDLDGFQFAGLVNVGVRDVRGGQFAGLFNAARGTTGIQGAGLGNVADGELDGVQAAGLFNTVAAPARGGQFAGLFNAAGSRLRGGQAAGLANVAVGDLHGYQAAGLFNLAVREVQGVQAAGLFNAARRGPALQAAGLANIAAGGTSGVQVAGLANVSGGPVRLQVGSILNAAGTVEHGQIGLFNFARSNDGLALGFFSYVHDVGLALDVWTDETGLVTTVVRSGNRRFSNFIGYGAHPGRSAFGHGPVVGAGTEFAVARQVFGAVDVLHQGLSDRRWRDWAQLTRLRALLGWRLNDAVAVFGGPVLNLLLSDDADSRVVAPWHLARGQWGSVHYAYWPGFAVGLRIAPLPIASSRD